MSSTQFKSKRNNISIFFNCRNGIVYGATKKNILSNASGNSVVLITGASSGIGRELAITYAKRKCR